MRRLFVFAALLAAADPTEAGSWIRAVGGPGADRAHALLAMPDRGLLAAGETASFGMGGRDVLALRTGPCGDVVWQRSYGDALDQRALAATLLAGGAALLAGETRTSAGDLDLALLEIDLAGTVTWRAVLGGPGDESGVAAAATDDGGFAVAAAAFDEITGNAETWVVRFDGQRQIAWQRRYAGTENDFPAAIAVRGDLVAVAGTTDSSGAGLSDGWIAVLGDVGAIAWQRTYGGAGDEGFASIAAGPNGFAAAGFTESWGAGLYDVWLVAIDGAGDVLWQQTYGGVDDDEALAAARTAGGWYFAGRTLSFGGGDEDAWTMRTDDRGDLSWQTRIGGTSNQRIQALADGSGSPAFAGLVEPGSPGDVLVGRLDAAGNASSSCSIAVPASFDASAAPASALPGALASTATTATVRTMVWAAASAAGTSQALCATAPGEVSPPYAAVPLSVDRVRLTWEPALPSCSETFAVYRGDVAGLPLGDHGTCLDSDLVVPEFGDTSEPPIGQGWFYLVTGAADEALGTAGIASDGTERTPIPGP